VLGGQSVAQVEERGLSEEEKGQNYILSCVRTAVTDMRLGISDLGSQVLPAVRTLPCRIASLGLLAPDVMRVVIRLPPGSKFAFLPGQYVNLIGQGGIRRSYSLANSDAEQSLELHIKAVPGGLMSTYWFERARVNDLLRLSGPHGTFFLRDMQGLDLIFLATGTGIAPIKSMLAKLDSSFREYLPRSVRVYWGGRIRSDLYLNFSETAANCLYIPVLSRAGGDWNGARGHVQQALVADNPDLDRAIVYACGSEAMIQSARALLLRHGLAEARFLADAFVCSSQS
jgi:CDP-4-dehydro-6-deoxyglucose reductase